MQRAAWSTFDQFWLREQLIIRAVSEATDRYRSYGSRSAQSYVWSVKQDVTDRWYDRYTIDQDLRIYDLNASSGICGSKLARRTCTVHATSGHKRLGSPHRMARPSRSWNFGPSIHFEAPLIISSLVLSAVCKPAQC